MKQWLGIGVVLGAVWMAGLQGETVKDREGAVRGDREALQNDERWIYNDLDAGFAEAARTGRPLLVVLRCVPCLACAGIDARVLEEGDLSDLLDRFVCVRIINANALDLARFQFDYDLSFSTMFFNPDGAVYGRFGSWRHQKDPKDETTAGFRRALEGVLALHAGYPGNQGLVSGKQGRPVEWSTPLDLPGIGGRFKPELDWKGQVVPSCVHCHQIGDGIREAHRAKGERVPDRWIYPMPGAEVLGITLAVDEPTRITAVSPGSAAASAGLRPDDRLDRIAGQRPVSMADVAWALHGAPEAGAIEVRIRRGDDIRTVPVPLEAGWRRASDISRRVGTWPMRAWALGGMVLHDLEPGERDALGIAGDTLALKVGHVGQYGNHAAAKRAGFRSGDIIRSVGGESAYRTESALIGWILRSHDPGDRLEWEVDRSGERLSLTLAVQ